MYLHACGQLHSAKLELGVFGTHAHTIMHGRARMPPLQQANHGRPEGRTMTRRQTNMWAGPKSHYVGGRFLSFFHSHTLCLLHDAEAMAAAGAAAVTVPRQCPPYLRWGCSLARWHRFLLAHLPGR
jgi:hypothetical protein